MSIFDLHPGNCMRKVFTETNKFFQLIRTCFFAIIFLMTGKYSFCQNPDTVITLSKDINEVIIKNFAAGYLPVSFNIERDYDQNILSKQPLKISPVKANNVSKKIVSRFSIINDGDKTDSLYFFPGLFFRNVLLYKVDNNKATLLPVIAPQVEDSISFRLISIPAHDTATILAECYSARTYTSIFRPRLISPGYLETFFVKAQLVKKSVTLFTYIFCGLLLMMILFSLANFLQGRNKEFFYYAAYAFFLGFMLFTKQFYYNQSNEINFFYESYLDFVLQTLGIWFFLLFMVRFLETRKNFPFLHKLYMSGIIFLPIVIILYSFIHYSSIDYYWEYLLENYITKNLLLALMIIFLVYALRNWHHKLLRYLFWGNLLYLVFAFASLLIVISRTSFRLPGILNDSLVLYELGLLIELIFFLMGLTYKNKTQLIEQTTERARLKMENERKELEKQMAVLQAHQEERERISADIHDELGSGMTTIRLMSEIAKNKLKENVPVEVEKISNSANEVLNKMNAIIWSMNSSNDTLDSLISYIRAYSIEYFDATPIECKVKMPDIIPFKEITGDKRRNVFLCVKETLNNTLKHSKATKVIINIETSMKLKIHIADNGAGIDPEKISRFGNGLKNIERRMKAIGGTCSIANNNGTITKLELPL